MEGFGGGGFADALKKMFGTSSSKSSGNGDNTKKVFDALATVAGKKKKDESDPESEQSPILSKISEFINKKAAPQQQIDTNPNMPKNILQSTLNGANAFEDEEKKKKLFLA